MCLKVFSLKNSNFKNPISALFKQLMISIYGFLDSFLRPIIEKKIFQKKLNIYHQQMLEKNVNFISQKLNNETNNNLNENNEQANSNNESPLHKNIDDFIEHAKNEPYSSERRKTSEDKKLANEEMIIGEKIIEQDNKLKKTENEHVINNYLKEQVEEEQEFNAENNINNEGNQVNNNQENVEKEAENVNERIYNKRNSDSNSFGNNEQEKQNLETNEFNAAENDINNNIISLNNTKKANANITEIANNQEMQIQNQTNSNFSPESDLEKRYTNNPAAMQQIESIKIKLEEIDLSEFTSFEIYQTSLAIFKSLILIAEGKKKDWIASSVYSKCLGLELIAGIICQSGFVIKFIPEFTNLIKTDLHRIIKKNFESTNDYAIGLKLSRLTIQIVQNLNICYDLISFLLKYAENQLVPWQKLIGIECLSSLLSNSFLLKDLYEKKFNQDEKQKTNAYDDLISSLTKISYACVTNKQQDSKKTAATNKAGTEAFGLTQSSKTLKNIENSSILTEADVQIPNYTAMQLFKLITECYANIRDSYVIILETANLKLGVKNQTYDEEQLLSKDMIHYNYEAIKNSMTALILNSTDESLTQNYLMLFQSYINIFGSIALPIARDSYLNDLCKLAIPNNLENSLELSSKNILITKMLFNIAHCVNILDSNSWLLLIETMQKIYLMLINSNNHLIKPNEEFDIDVIIKNLETNIRKFNPNYKLNTNEDIHVNSSNYNNINNNNNLNNENNENLNENIIEAKNLDNKEESVSSMQQANNNNNLNNVQDTTNSANNNTSSVATTNSNVEVHSEKKRGLFSTLKSAFGLGRAATKPENTAGSSATQRKGQTADENIDIQILSGAIDTLFINSTMYEEDTLKDITKAFLESSKTILANNPVANDISNIYINFNLTKLLELAVINVHRIPLFWDSIIDLISFIAQKNANNISRFALDCLTIINMFLLGEYNSGKIEYFMRSSINKDLIEKHWEGDSWQNTIFQPFKAIAQQNISQNININIIYNLSKILQNSGNYLNYQGWNNYIQICDVLVSKNDEIICENVFRLIEQIINEYADYLTLSNINCLIDNLEIFAQYKKNTNISFIAITMFWNISGIAEKFIKLVKLPQEKLENSKEYNLLTDYQKDFFRKYESSTERTIYISNIWLDFFSKIVGICSDNLFDVRKSAINIFADIFVAKNFLIENTTAIEIINKYFLEILDKSYSIFEDKMKSNRAKKNITSDNQSAQLKTPKFNDVSDIKIGDFKVDQLKLPEKKIKFDEEAMQKLNQPSAEELEWEETTILLTQAIGKVLRSFLNRNLNVVKDFNYYTESLINSLIKKYTKIMRMTTPKLAGTILGSLQEIYNSNIDLFMNQFENLWKIYQEMGKFITTDFYLNNLCTMATSSKMISNVLEILKEIFLKESNLTLKPDLLQGKNLENLLNFTNMLIKSSRNSEGIQTITNPQRILFDEKIIFDFIEKVSKLLNNPNAWKIYTDFLCSYIYFDLNEHHSEAHCRKALEMFETFFNSIALRLNGKEEKNLSLDKPEVFGENEKQKSFVILEFINEHLPKLLDCVKDLCALRNKNEYVAVLIKNNKSQLQIWHYATFQLIKILSLILCKNQINKKKEEEINIEVLANTLNSNKSLIANLKNDVNNISYSDSNNESNKSLIKNHFLDDVENNNQMNEIWESAIRCFETIFRQSEAGYKNISRNLMEDLLKSCQDMEIQIINFIVNSLLPNSLKIPKEMQIKLLTLLDIGSNFDYNILNNLTQTATNTSSISRVCIENLFELCKYRTEESLKKGIIPN